MAEIERLKKRRTVIRSLSTKLINKIDTLILESTNEETSFSERIETLNELHEQLNVKSNDLKELDRQIEQNVTDSEFENEVIISEELQEKFIHYKCKIVSYIKLISTSNSNANSAMIETPQRVSKTEVNGYTDIQDSKIKLPKLSIPKFNGDPCSWIEFWNQFKNSIHENKLLSDIDKFLYLKQLLIGNAANAVAGYTIESENYKAALELLENRFGRKDLVINSHMTKLLSIEPVKSINNITSLRKLYDECEIQIRNLKSLNVASGTYGQLLCPILIKNLPEQLALEFNRKRKTNCFDITELMEFIRVEVECREASNMLSSNNTKFYSNVKSFEYEKRNLKRNMPTASALLSNVNNCNFCSLPHESTECRELNIEQKRTQVLSQGLCIRCLKKNHRSYQCYWSKFKNCSICKSSKHCTACHGINLKQESENYSRLKTETVVSTQHVDNSNNSENVILQTCSAFINEKGKSKIIRILMDNASQRTFISSKVVKDLKLPIIRKENLFVYSFGSRLPKKQSFDVVCFKLINRKEPEKNVEIEALVTSCITGARVNVPSKQIFQALKLKPLELADNLSNKPIELLIGANYFWSINNGDILKLSNHIYAIKSLFGWCLQGKIERLGNEKADCAINFLSVSKFESSHENSELTNQLKSFWELESLGIMDNKGDFSTFDANLIDKFEANLKIVDGRYQTSLLWGTDIQGLESNYRNAERRFIKLRSDLENNEWLLENYSKVIEEYIDEGIVEETNTSINKTYYMPHRAVVRKDKETTKVRIVFDASSKGKNCSSLNDCLLKGPNLNPSVLDTILKFREHKIAFCCDLKQAYLQISINPRDRNYLRFIWFKYSNDESSDVKILRMTRVPFGVACSSFILSAIIKFHIRKYKEIKSEVYDMLNNYFYVDDLFYGSNTVDKAFQLSFDAVSVMNDAHMQLRKFKTNSPELKSLWLKEGIIKNEDSIEDSVSALGLIWDSKLDVLEINVNSLLDILPQRKCTKRFVLQLAARIYDPIGFLTPFIVRMKCLLQNLWQAGLEWDEEIPKSMSEAVNLWCSEIRLVPNLIVKRYYFQSSNPINEVSYELHIFSDANPQVYGAVAYFRYLNNEGKFNCTFVMSKSRVAPIKKISLPRLELMGALIAARLANHLINLFRIPCDKVHLWTDSTIALFWIKGSASQWKQFV